MARLLDLSPEVRLMIWKLVVISRTGHIEPVSRRDAYAFNFANSRSFSSPHYYLPVVERSNKHYQEPEAVHEKRKIRYECSNEYMSTSLLSVCRAAYNEAKFLFWDDNTFDFASSLIASNYLKKMGQVCCRKITSIQTDFLFDSNFELGTLDTLLSTLRKHCKTGGSIHTLEIRMQTRSLIHYTRLLTHGFTPVFKKHSIIFDTIEKTPSRKLPKASIPVISCRAVKEAPDAFDWETQLNPICEEIREFHWCEKENGKWEDGKWDVLYCSMEEQRRNFSHEMNSDFAMSLVRIAF